MIADNMDNFKKDLIWNSVGQGQAEDPGGDILRYRHRGVPNDPGIAVHGRIEVPSRMNVLLFQHFRDPGHLLLRFENDREIGIIGSRNHDLLKRGPADRRKAV